jgi:hypothetical protein
VVHAPAVIAVVALREAAVDVGGAEQLDVRASDADVGGETRLFHVVNVPAQMVF